MNDRWHQPWNTGAGQPHPLRSRPDAGLTDAPAVATLLTACAETDETDHTWAMLTRGLAASVGRLWFAENGTADAPLGCAYIAWNGDRYGVPQLLFHIHPQARGVPVEDAVMAWVEQQLPRFAETVVSRLDVHLRPGADQYRSALLERHGFTRVESVIHRFCRALHTPIPTPVLPTGYRIRALEGEHELASFVALFRDIFGAGPTVEAIAERWQRAEHVPEIVVEAPDGTLVALCYLEVGSSSQMSLTPHDGCIAQLGTAKAYRQQGFGRAALRAGLQELRQRGMSAALLQTGGANEVAHRLYTTEGFHLAESLPRLRYFRSAV